MSSVNLKISTDEFDELARQELRRLRWKAERALVLETDEGFNAFVAKRSGLPFGPFVRASTYRNVAARQDIWFAEFGSDPRRPVVMLGALARIKGSWSSKSGYFHHVGLRYLKKIGFTAFRREETRKMEQILSIHMNRRGHEYHRHYDLVKPAFCNSQYAQAWIGGELKFLTAQEWRRLRKLHPPSMIVRRKSHQLLVRPRAQPEPDSQKTEPVICEEKQKLTLKQRKTAAYRALKELGIQF